MTDPRTLTLHELAARLGIAHRTAAALLAEGKGPGIKVGGRYLIREDWVTRFEAGEPGFWSPTGERPAPAPAVDHPYVRRLS